jgi:hypothetical protein
MEISAGKINKMADSEIIALGDEVGGRGLIYRGAEESSHRAAGTVYRGSRAEMSDDITF